MKTIPLLLASTPTNWLANPRFERGAPAERGQVDAGVERADGDAGEELLHQRAELREHVVADVRAQIVAARAGDPRRQGVGQRRERHIHAGDGGDGIRQVREIDADVARTHVQPRREEVRLQRAGVVHRDLDVTLELDVGDGEGAPPLIGREPREERLIAHAGELIAGDLDDHLDLPRAAEEVEAAGDERERGMVDSVDDDAPRARHTHDGHGHIVERGLDRASGADGVDAGRVLQVIARHAPAIVELLRNQSAVGRVAAEHAGEDIVQARHVGEVAVGVIDARVRDPHRHRTGQRFVRRRIARRGHERAEDARRPAVHAVDLDRHGVDAVARVDAADEQTGRVRRHRDSGDARRVHVRRIADRDRDPHGLAWLVDRLLAEGRRDALDRERLRPDHPAVAEASVGHASVGHAPVHHAPVEHAPVEHAPVEHAPVEHAPVEHAPVEHAPVEHAPVADGTVAAVERRLSSVARARVPAAGRDARRPAVVTRRRQGSEQCHDQKRRDAIDCDLHGFLRVAQHRPTRRENQRLRSIGQRALTCFALTEPRP